jgi:hypothetical protein
VQYDFKRDQATAPDWNQSIPDSQSVVRRSDRRCGQRLVNLAFQILEIDMVTEEKRAAIDEVGALATQLADLAGAVPYLQALSPTLHVAGRLGECTLRAYTKPDHVISIDMSFAILKRGAAILQGSGDSLRYGYVFVLSRPLDVKLYAATGSKHVRLMMRTSAGIFVSLKHVLYLVVKVGVPFEDLCNATPTMGGHHARRLQDVCRNVDNMTSKEVEKVGYIMVDLSGLAGCVPAHTGVLNPGAAAAVDMGIGNAGERVNEVLQ